MSDNSQQGGIANGPLGKYLTAKPIGPKEGYGESAGKDNLASPEIRRKNDRALFLEILAEGMAARPADASSTVYVSNIGIELLSIYRTTEGGVQIVLEPNELETKKYVFDKEMRLVGVKSKSEDGAVSYPPNFRAHNGHQDLVEPAVARKAIAELEAAISRHVKQTPSELLESENLAHPIVRKAGAHDGLLGRIGGRTGTRATLLERMLGQEAKQTFAATANGDMLYDEVDNHKSLQVKSLPHGFTKISTTTLETSDDEFTQQHTKYVFDARKRLVAVQADGPEAYSYPPEFDASKLEDKLYPLVDKKVAARAIGELENVIAHLGQSKDSPLMKSQAGHSL